MPSSHSIQKDQNTPQSNVLSIEAARKKRRAYSVPLEYQAKILMMSKVELLEEMLRFQEERTTLGGLNFELIKKGQVLFRSLEQAAETRELKLLTGSYRKHLDLELEELLKREG